MTYSESLIWILDKFDEQGKPIHGDALYQENIDFMHSLKLKCDSVGWCRMSLDRPDTGDILNRIESFCRENGWRARGYYERTYTGFDCGWYELIGPHKKEAIESLTAAQYAPLAPYYAVTGHGFLSDEYELLSPDLSETETLAFAARMEQEELISERICGIVFCKCPDGDRVLLKEDGSISRVSHEAPEDITHWKNAAEFFSDALLDT